MSKVLLRSGTVLLLSLLLLVLTGCASLGLNRVTVYPIENEDIILVEEGEQFTAPKQGMFLSQFYYEEVMKAKVD